MFNLREKDITPMTDKPINGTVSPLPCTALPRIVDLGAGFRCCLKVEAVTDELIKAKGPPWVLPQDL